MLSENYILQAGLFKALSDPNRLMIVDMLSCGELCACKILEQFNITQPTLTSIPPLPLAAQIVMKTGLRCVPVCGILYPWRRYTTKHGEVSRRLPLKIKTVR